MPRFTTLNERLMVRQASGATVATESVVRIIDGELYFWDGSAWQRVEGEQTTNVTNVTLMNQSSQAQRVDVKREIFFAGLSYRLF